MIVIADDQQGTLLRQVFLAFYRPEGEGKYQKTY
jgi:hypothetical protein